MDNKTKKKNPEVRFKEFTKDWMEKELGNIFEITSASRVHKNEWTKSGVPFFRSSDVVSNYKGTDNTKAFISFELYNKLSTISGIVQENDLLVTGGGSIGIPYLIKSNEPLYFKDADLLWLKSANKINGYFLYSFFATSIFKKYVSSIAHIGTISHYTIDQAKSTPIIVPSLCEQKQIGSFFQNLDNLITLHQKKYDKLIILKKAMLVKMFPKNGAVVPEIRFKGFTEDWEEKRIGDFTQVKRGLTYSPIDVSVKGIKVLRSSNISENTFVEKADDVYVNEEAINIEFAKESDILITSANGSSRLVGKHAILENLNIKAVHGGFMLIARTKYPYFLNASMSSPWYRKFINMHMAGGNGAIGNLKSSDFEEYYILIPNEDEQIKIGQYFKNLDSQIALHQTQLDKLNNIKKACFSKMFVAQD
jgi:type I restriction enzyme S subunit